MEEQNRGSRSPALSEDRDSEDGQEQKEESPDPTPPGDGNDAETQERVVQDIIEATRVLENLMKNDVMTGYKNRGYQSNVQLYANLDSLRDAFGPIFDEGAQIIVDSIIAGIPDDGLNVKTAAEAALTDATMRRIREVGDRMEKQLATIQKKTADALDKIWNDLNDKYTKRIDKAEKEKAKADEALEKIEKDKEKTERRLEDAKREHSKALDAEKAKRDTDFISAAEKLIGGGGGGGGAAPLPVSAGSASVHGAEADVFLAFMRLVAGRVPCELDVLVDKYLYTPLPAPGVKKEEVVMAGLENRLNAVRVQLPESKTAETKEEAGSDPFAALAGKLKASQTVSQAYEKEEYDKRVEYYKEIKTDLASDSIPGTRFEKAAEKALMPLGSNVLSRWRMLQTRQDGAYEKASLYHVMKSPTVRDAFAGLCALEIVIVTNRGSVPDGVEGELRMYSHYLRSRVQMDPTKGSPHDDLWYRV